MKRKIVRLAALGLALLLFATGCGKSGLSEIPPTDIAAADAIAAAKADEKTQTFLDGKTVVKEIYVPGKLVNLVVKG